MQALPLVRIDDNIIDIVASTEKRVNLQYFLGSITIQ